MEERIDFSRWYSTGSSGDLLPLWASFAFPNTTSSREQSETNTRGCKRYQISISLWLLQPSLRWVEVRNWFRFPLLLLTSCSWIVCHNSSNPRPIFFFFYQGKWFDYARHHQEALSHNERLWGHCAQHRNRQDCFSPRFLSRYCSLFPFQSMKTVRLRMNITRQIIEDQSLKNVQVLLLVRDPRGTLQSRKHRVWCPGHPDCEDPNRLCSDLVDDFYSARRMMNDYPGRVM